MILHLVRHGESEGNAGLSGEIDCGLTDLGRRQAEHTALRLAENDVTAVLCSPFRRAIETTFPVCKHTGLVAELFPLACEWFCGEWPLLKPFCGRLLEVIADSHPSVGIPARARGARWWPEWPEPMAQFSERCARAVAEVLERFDRPNDTVVVYGHAASCLGIATVLLGPTYWSDMMQYENCALTTIQIGPDRTELVRFRDVPDVE